MPERESGPKLWPAWPVTSIVMDVDAWSSKLQPDQVFQQFKDTFITFSQKWIPQLDLTPEKLDSNYGSIKQFAPCLEVVDEPFLGNSSIVNAVSHLDDLIGRLNNETRDALRLITTDVLFCGSLIPVFLDPAPRTFTINPFYEF